MCRQSKVQGVSTTAVVLFVTKRQSCPPTQACYCSIHSTTTALLGSSHHQPPHRSIRVSESVERRLTRSTLVLLTEDDKLSTVVDGEHTGTGNTTENVGTSTLEERLDTLSGDDLAGGIHGTLVLDGLQLLACDVHKWSIEITYFTRSHHHTTADSVERVRGNTGTSGDSPSEQERGQEVTLEGTGEDDGLKRVVHTEVQTTVDDYAKNRGTETTVETGNTVGGEGLLVDIYQTVELTVTALLGVLCVVGKTGTGVVEGVDEKQGSGTSSLYGQFCEIELIWKYLHHRRLSYRPSIWRNRHDPS
jgi:hypothetical protein